MSFFGSQVWSGAKHGILAGAALDRLRQSRAYAAVARAWADGLRPPPDLKVSEWAEEYRYVAPPTPNEGPWRNDRTPYLVGVMDVLSPSHPAREIDAIKGTQLGFTEFLLNVVGYYSDQVPGTTGMIVLPTKFVATEWSKLRLQALFGHTEPLRRLVASQDNRRGSKSNTAWVKQLANGSTWKIAWASSGAMMRSTPAGIILADEVDGMNPEIPGEGNTMDVLRNRFANYRRGKFARVSSPTNKRESLIEQGYLAGDQRRFFVPCPHCRHRQVLMLDNLIWPDGRPEEAAFKCVSCEQLIPEFHKTQMLAEGMWLATREVKHLVKTGFAEVDIPRLAGILAQMDEAEHPSFHLPSFYSPMGWYSWRAFAAEWSAAQGDPAKLKVLVMTKLGETWLEKGEAPDWEKVYGRRERYEEGTAPAGVLFLTAGVDVQADRLEVELVGWGRGRESWSVNYVVIPGDTSTEEPWLLLDEVMRASYPTADGRSLPIMVMGVDTGFRPQKVYEFARRHRQADHGPAGTRIRFPRTVVPFKGNSDGYKIIFGKSTADAARKRGGVVIVTVGTAAAKQDVYDSLRLPAPTNEGEAYPAGYCHFPASYDADYFRGLTSESRVVRVNGKAEWVRDPAIRNEPLDCRVYARAAAAIYGLDRFTDTHWRRMGWDPSQQIVLSFVVDEVEDGESPLSVAERVTEAVGVTDEGAMEYALAGVPVAEVEAAPMTVSKPVAVAVGAPKRAMTPRPRVIRSKYLYS